MVRLLTATAVFGVLVCLAAVTSAADLEDLYPAVRTRAEWGAQPRSGSPSYHTPHTLVVHHTYSPTHANYNSAVASDGDGDAPIQGVQEYHMRPKSQGGNGWSDIGYHYLIGPDGVIYEGRPPDTIGAHVGGQNTNRVGVCMVGNFEAGFDDATAAQTESLEAILTYLAVRFDIDPFEQLPVNNGDEALCGHRDLGSTQCPGDDLWASLPALRQAVVDRINGADVEEPDPCGDVNCFNDGVCEDGECECPDGFYGSDCGTSEKNEDAGGQAPDEDESRLWLVFVGIGALFAGLLFVLGVAAILNPTADVTPIGRQRGPSRFDFGVASSFKVGNFGVANRDAKGSLPPLPPADNSGKLPYAVADEDPKTAAAGHAPERSDVHQLAVDASRPSEQANGGWVPPSQEAPSAKASVATVPMKQSVLSAKSAKSKKSFASKTVAMTPAEDPVQVSEEPPAYAVATEASGSSKKGGSKRKGKGSHRSKKGSSKGSKGSHRSKKGSHRSKKGGSKGSKGSRRHKKD